MKRFVSGIRTMLVLCLFLLAAGQPAVATTQPLVSGTVYYDANANGQLDPGEVGIANWPIDFVDLTGGTILTNATGSFLIGLFADTFTFSERQAQAPWTQTGNVVNQSTATGGATATLNSDKTYTVTLLDGSTASGLYFGNRCLGGGNARGIGFWTNRNGQPLYGADDNAMLVSLNLRTADGSDFNPTGYAQFNNWILGATATNMAYALSAQLAAAELNVLNGFVSAGSIISAPGTASANALGFATVGAVMDEANTSLGLYGYTLARDPERPHQAALKNALEGVNNNTGFVQPGPETCPAPVF